MDERNPEKRRIALKAEEAGQGHLLRFWDRLGPGERDLLLRDIDSVDFSVVERFKDLFKGGGRGLGSVKPPEAIPIPATPGELRAERDAREAGEARLRAGKVALFVAAGGQSSRLGLDSPKGTYPVTPVRGKSLFQVFAEMLRVRSERHGAAIPWVVMVSDTNREETERFFRDHGFFGLPEEMVRFTEQSMLPAVDDDGKVLLRERHRLFLSPGGHGGTFSALRDSGALEWLSGMGVEEIFYFQVDNVLAKILDPVFIGHHVLGECRMSSKFVRRKSRGEKLGVYASLDGRPAVVEYSERGLIDAALGEGASARFDAGNIAIHVLDLRFCAEQSRGGNRLPLHLARKAIPHVGPTGEKVVPVEPNGYKLETFIFDALRCVERSALMEVRREEEFSPLKNKTGEDSPETVLRDQLLLYAGWLEASGFTVPRGAHGLPLHRIEVSPLFALSGEECAMKLEGRGGRVDKDTCIE